MDGYRLKKKIWLNWGKSETCGCSVCTRRKQSCPQRNLNPHYFGETKSKSRSTLTKKTNKQMTKQKNRGLLFDHGHLLSFHIWSVIWRSGRGFLDNTQVKRSETVCSWQEDRLQITGKGNIHWTQPHTASVMRIVNYEPFRICWWNTDVNTVVSVNGTNC